MGVFSPQCILVAKYPVNHKLGFISVRCPTLIYLSKIRNDKREGSNSYISLYVRFVFWMDTFICRPWATRKGKAHSSVLYMLIMAQSTCAGEVDSKSFQIPSYYCTLLASRCLTCSSDFCSLFSSVFLLFSAEIIRVALLDISFWMIFTVCCRLFTFSADAPSALKTIQQTCTFPSYQITKY